MMEYDICIRETSFACLFIVNGTVRELWFTTAIENGNYFYGKERTDWQLSCVSVGCTDVQYSGLYPLENIQSSLS